MASPSARGRWAGGWSGSGWTGAAGWLDTDGAPLRVPGWITARYPGHIVHVDVNKVGWIADDGGWRVDGRESEQHRAAERAKTAGTARLRLPALRGPRVVPAAYAEALPDETAATAIGS